VAASRATYRLLKDAFGGKERERERERERGDSGNPLTAGWGQSHSPPNRAHIDESCLESTPFAAQGIKLPGLPSSSAHLPTLKSSRHTVEVVCREQLRVLRAFNVQASP